MYIYIYIYISIDEWPVLKHHRIWYNIHVPPSQTDINRLIEPWCASRLWWCMVPPFPSSACYLRLPCIIIIIINILIAFMVDQRPREQRCGWWSVAKYLHALCAKAYVKPRAWYRYIYRFIDLDLLYRCIHRFIDRSIDHSISLSFYLSIYLTIYVSISLYVSITLCIYVSIYREIDREIDT